MRNLICLGFSALVLAACASEPERSTDPFDMSGGRYVGARLERALADAEKHKLGSANNPVRADMPLGQRAYLDRLRCSDGSAPKYERSGNLGFGAFGSIVDAYDVRCAGSSPAASTIIMDMYFPGHVEMRAVEGFTIVAP